jgi:hypothetical protein
MVKLIWLRASAAFRDTHSGPAAFPPLRRLSHPVCLLCVRMPDSGQRRAQPHATQQVTSSVQVNDTTILWASERRLS